MYADGFTKRLREAPRTTSNQEQSSRLCLLILCAQYAAPEKTNSLSNKHTAHQKDIPARLGTIPPTSNVTYTRFFWV